MTSRSHPQQDEALSSDPLSSEQPYDALLVLSFGGPEAPDDVMPFLRNVTKGRNVPENRLAEVAKQYEIFGGKSPINDQCRALISALTVELASHSIDLPIYWGNRNWEPFLTNTVRQMADDGIKRAAVFTTSAFGSYSGCRQYRENLLAAQGEVDGAPQLDKLRLFYNHPGFIEPMAENLNSSLAERPLPNRRIVFTAHSIPVSMAQSCSYQAQLEQAAKLVLEQAGREPDFDLVFQSRSGPPTIPWLEPDVNDHLHQLAANNTSAVAVVPLGFISDHMEVMFDLDTQAVATAQQLGLELNRAKTVGVDAAFVAMIRALIEEQTNDQPRLFVGSSGPWPDQCPEGHCLAAQRPAGTR